MLIARLIAEMPDWEIRLEAARTALARAGGAAGAVERMANGALEWRVEGVGAEQLHAVIDAEIGPVDHLVSAGPIAPPALFVSDMDSTMIGQECIDELADYAGIKDQIAAITERAMQGELDFEAALRERVGLLAGLEDSAITRCLAERIRPNPGARELVQALKAHGVRTVLVTGGFDHFADRVGEDIGFDRVVGNRLGVKDGVLTGELEGAISDAHTKARVLAEEAAALGEGATSLAIGDGANDIPMIEAATLGFAYRAKPKARAAASGRIESGDLGNILVLLGLSRGV